MNDVVTPDQMIQGRRTPTQQRSRSRVDAILNATRDLIHEKGTGGLKIQDLAERANITPSSIYQYFSNKRAIIQALDQRYINNTHDLLAKRLENIQSLEEGFAELQGAIDDYYEWYSSEPVIFDIWNGMAADKAMRDMELQSSRESAELIMKALTPFVEPEDIEGLESYALLLSHLAGSTIRMCLMSEDKEKRRLHNAFKTLMGKMSADLLKK